MASGAIEVHRIQLRLRELGQLFNSMDPTPFHHKDLDPDAEAFIESWALEFPADSQFEITIHLEDGRKQDNPDELVSEALHNFFNYKAELVRRELRQLLSQGRMSLMIGVSFLALCLFAADGLARVAPGPPLSILRESLTIGGWVAMWKPMQIFLYDWWPLRRKLLICRRLGRAHVRVLLDSKAHA